MQLFIGETPVEDDVRRALRLRPQLALERAAADDVEPAAEPLCGGDGEVDPLVGDQAAPIEEPFFVTETGNTEKLVSPHGRIDDLSHFPSVELLDPGGRRARVGQEDVRPLRGGEIEDAKTTSDEGLDEAATGAAVDLGHPKRTGRGVVVADVEGVGAFANPVGERMAIAKDDVEFPQIEARVHPREKGRVDVVTLQRPRETLNVTGSDIETFEKPNPARVELRGKDRARVQVDHFPKDILGSARNGQPVVYERDLHHL